MSKIAMYYEKVDSKRVHCSLCPHQCIILPERVGVCRARKNIGGELYSLNYGKVASAALDPIEKKPLYRFHPGSYILSTGTFGCNLKCSFCQNWTIAHHDPETDEFTPEELAEKAHSLKRHGNIGIAYTYNEPSIWYEFVYETAKLVKENGMVNVLVSNGFISPDPLENLLPYIDAMNIDVKGYTDRFYHDICKGGLDAVKRAVEIAAPKCHVEITTLVIPGLNDSREEIGKLAQWLSSISPEIPLHLSRFFPNYQMRDVPPTPVNTLENLRDEAARFLKYVYLGNV